MEQGLDRFIKAQKAFYKEAESLDVVYFSADHWPGTK